MDAQFANTIEPPWDSAPVVAVGDLARAGASEPDAVVLVGEAERGLRIHVHAFLPDSFPFQESLVWNGTVFVGFGSHAYAVSLRDSSVVSFELGSYFGSFKATDAYVLIATGERVLRIEPDRRVRWTSEAVGVDGVLIHEPDPPVIRGDGEWDPPGDWRPFSLDAGSGTILESCP